MFARSFAWMAPRGKNSLGVITQKFFNWIVDGNAVNLNEAALTLNVSKRRLYDVVNVLEGIGIVEKCGMNYVRWRKGHVENDLSSLLHSECIDLQSLESYLDANIQRLTLLLKHLAVDSADSQYAYIRLQDLRSSEMFMDRTLIAVKSATDGEIKTSFSRMMNSSQNQLKFQTSENRTLQGLLSPAGSFVHSDFEHLFVYLRPTSHNGELSTTNPNVTVKDPLALSSEWKECEGSQNSDINAVCLEDTTTLKKEPISEEQKDLLFSQYNTADSGNGYSVMRNELEVQYSEEELAIFEHFVNKESCSVSPMVNVDLDNSTTNEQGNECSINYQLLDNNSYYLSSPLVGANNFYDFWEQQAWEHYYG